MTHSYDGVYSTLGAGTTVGTKLHKEPGGKIGSVELAGTNADRHLITTQTLLESELNVAKIRLVSTLPGKEVPEEMQGKAYVGFILTGVQEAHNEKVEIIPLPGDTFASYFYGASPRQFNFSGILLNTEQDQWRDGFEQIYEKHLRGSVSSRNFSIVQVSYSGRVVSGWLTNLSQQLDSSNDHYSSFSFSVLVSRVDMVGGSKKFSDYLIKLTDNNNEFAKANISADYAVLDPSNYNGMIDPIRTGMVIPPKRPHKARGRKSRPQNCWFPAEVTDAGKNTNTGAVTANNHINDATVCTVIAAIEGTNAKINEKMKQAEKLLEVTKDRVPSDKDIQDAKRLEAEAKALSLAIQREMAKDEVKEQLDAESEALVGHIKEARKRLKAGETVTALEKQRIKELEAGSIKVGSATLDIIAPPQKDHIHITDDFEFIEQGEIISISFDPTVDDGSGIKVEGREELFADQGKDKDGNKVSPKNLGLGDLALKARKKQDKKEAEERKKQQASAGAKSLLERT